MEKIINIKLKHAFLIITLLAVAFFGSFIVNALWSSYWPSPGHDISTYWGEPQVSPPLNCINLQVLRWNDPDLNGDGNWICDNDRAGGSKPPNRKWYISSNLQNDFNTLGYISGTDYVVLTSSKQNIGVHKICLLQGFGEGVAFSNGGTSGDGIYLGKKSDGTWEIEVEERGQPTNQNYWSKIIVECLD